MPRGDDWPGRPAPVFIFDLDGTILDTNSFPFWVVFLIGGRIPGLRRRARLGLSARAAHLLLARKLGRLSHATFLRRLQRAWHRAAPCADALRGFQAALLRRVRPNLQALLDQVAASRIDAVLATAAASEYALGLGRQLGFRHVVASFPARDDAPLNAGEHKRDAVLRLLERQQWHGRPLVLLTDHLDDLPLMRASTVVCWFGPGDIGESVRPAHVIPGLELTDAGPLLALQPCTSDQAATVAEMTWS